MARFRRRNSFKRGRSLKRKRRSFRIRKRRFNKRIKRAVNAFAEKKYIDYSTSGNATNSGQFLYFNTSISQGTGSNTRVGLKCFARSLRIRLLLKSDYGNVRRFRVIVGAWNDYTSTAPATTAILQNPTSESISLYKRETLQQKEWIPMYDRSFVLWDYTTPQKLLKINLSGKRLAAKTMIFSTTNVVQQAYFMLIITDYAGLGPYPEYYLNSRLTFTDV